MDAVELLVVPERPVVLAGERSECDVVVEVRSKRAAATKVAPHALNLAIVIDKSGSMDGAKLEAAKVSCLSILKSLRANDLLTVVTFNDTAEVVVNPQVSREAAKDKIECITAEGQTNLSLGWYLGLLELQTHSTVNHNNRLLLLSDGQANAGETKKSILASEAAKSRDLGVSTSTVGIGDDFAEDLLEAIATESGGRFWYIKESRVEDIIEEEFQGSLSVVLDRPRLELSLPAGVTVGRELNSLSKSAGKYRVRPLKGDDYFNLAVRLDIQADAVDVTLDATLYDGEGVVAQASTTLRRVSRAEFVTAAVNPIVGSVVQQYEVTLTNEKMIDTMMHGELDLMKKMLIAEVDGMRVVQDALAAQYEDERTLLELKHLSMDMTFKGASITVADMLERFVREPEVGAYILRWRKAMMHHQHRFVNRRHEVHEFDEDLFESLVQGAIDLADILISRHPDQADVLARQQGILRDQLAGH